MTEHAILAVDQGTTGTKAHRLRSDGSFETLARFEHSQILPRPGWVEHDPEELMRHVEAALVAGGRPAAIGLANQGETVVAWDARTRRPIYNAIVWQDSRSAEMTERLKAQGAEELTRSRAGLPLDPYFSASKLRWLLENVSDARALMREGRLRLGTSDAYFLDRLTGHCATDVTTASRTSLMNLFTLSWDPELCALFGVPAECLPEIRPSAGPFGQTANGTPVAASITDQQAALFGHGCRSPGQSKITFGTGAFALGVCGLEPVLDRAGGLAATVAWKLRDMPCRYALEGGIYNAGSAVNWARALGLFGEYREIEDFEGESALSRRLVFVPALSGLACPHWDRRAAGLWLGLGLETSRADLMRAVLEGVALLGAGVLEAMGRHVPPAGPLSVDGGMTRNGYFLRFLANALNRPLMALESDELTGYGTALMAMIGAGLADPESLPPPLAARILVNPSAPLSGADHALFADAVRRCGNWR